MNNEHMMIEMTVSDNKWNCNYGINEALNEAENELTLIEETLSSIEALKPECDKFDYILAAGSGAICGIIDIFLVGKPGESPIGEITDKWFANRTKDFAKLCGWNGTDNLSSAIKYLEQKFKVPYDQTGTGDIAKGLLNLTPKNHHFKSLAHNPTLLGLFFSILDQFNNTSHFISEGNMITIDNANGQFELRGKNIPAKLICAFVNWFGHIISDMSGSSSAKGRGMGVPSPLWCWMNDVIALKEKLNITSSEFDKKVNELAVKIFEQGFDVRFQAAQAIPVFVNETLVRFIYSVRRLISYYKETPEESRSFELLWKKCESFSNATVKRMLTVAHGTFVLIDVGDAAIRGFAKGAEAFNLCEFFLRLNIIGVGLFTISLYGEVNRGIQLIKVENDVKFAKREKIIVQNYIEELKELSYIYDDADLVNFIDDIEKGDVNKALQKTIELGKKRGVSDDIIIKNQEDGDNYFIGRSNMSKSKKRLEEAQKQTEKIVLEANRKIEELGAHSSNIYSRLETLQNQFNKISNKPDELRVQCKELEKIRLNWKQQVEQIEKDYETAKFKARIGGGVGAGLGGAVIGLGPSAAMGVATTFGVASTGVPIAALNGAAATNAALAWLGGGTLAAGGGGVAAGQAFLALAGPIGCAIAGISILCSGASFLAAIFDKERLENIFCLISERDEKKYKLAIVELNERITRIMDESDRLKTALEKTISFGTNYSSMTKQQQVELFSYVNFMNDSTQLLVNPILGLQPNYTEADLDKFISENYSNNENFYSKHKSLIISIGNLIYNISLKEYDIKVLNKSFENNKEYLEAANITEKEFAANDVVNKACQALKYKYKNEKEHKNMNSIFESIKDNNSDEMARKNEFKKRLEEVANDVKNSDMSDEQKKKMLLTLTKMKEERVNLMITGCTGCGKSSTINALFNAEKAKVGTGPNPETMDIQCYELDNLILWDTPGLGDGVEADERHKKNIIRMLHETNEKGEQIIDLVLVIIDGSNKDMGTAYNLINNVIIPNLGESPEKRILIAINKADAAMLGRNWNNDEHRPMPKLIEFLDKKAISVRTKIKESTGVDVETIYYSAGYKEEGEPQEPSYNLLKLLLYIIRFTPDNKRIIVITAPKPIDEENSYGSNDEPQEKIIQEIAKEVSRGDIFKECFSTASNKGAEIGSKILGAPGKIVGATAGALVGSVWGGIKALFGKKKK